MCQVGFFGPRRCAPLQVREGDYFGVAVNRCARLRSAAHGGQVLLSLATQELVRDGLPEGVSLRDLGERRLKDLLHLRDLLAHEGGIRLVPSELDPLLTPRFLSGRTS